MTAIRAAAIKKIRAGLAQDNLLAHKLLNLGQKHSVDEWVLSAVVFFIMRKEPMGLNDVETIGVENALKIASLRECCIQAYRTDPIRVLEERPKLAGPMADTKRIEQLFGIGSSED